MTMWQPLPARVASFSLLSASWGQAILLPDRFYVSVQLNCWFQEPQRRHMGILFSALAAPEEPPSVVLVPPLLERERKGRSRFAKSSYDRLFGKPQLAMLFGDYLPSDIRGVIHFAPPEDQRINVTAKLGVPRPGAYAAAAAGNGGGSGGGGNGKAPVAGGSLTLRYQPSPDYPYTFFDIKARTRGAASAAAVRGCLFDPRTNLAVWAELPVVATAAGSGSSLAAASQLRLGAKYTSPAFSAGAVFNPAQSSLQQAFVVAKAGGLVFGAQTAPDLHLAPLFAAPLDRPAWAASARQCQLATSYAIAYQPQTGGTGAGGGGVGGGGRFTAAVELARDRELSISFLHHMAVQRQVRNPFEDKDVVGITNYLDVGFRMVSDLAGLQGSQMQLGASWQANKNVMLKGQVSLQSVSAAAVFKSWWQPAFTLAGSASYDYASGRARYGLTAAVETFKNIRYERSAAAQKMSGARITQRHVASEEDLAYHEGKGLLVPLEEVDNPEVLGQVPASGDEYL